MSKVVVEEYAKHNCYAEVRAYSCRCFREILKSADERTNERKFRKLLYAGVIEKAPNSFSCDYFI